MTLTLTALQLDDMAKAAREHHAPNAPIWTALTEGLGNGLLGFGETVDLTSEEAGEAFLERVKRYEFIRSGKGTV